LWRLFREASCGGGECRDIVEKHVLPKLNQTDVKFFYDVNTETRALIKSSSRKRELEKAFKVEEMSSISTLEFAWENRSSWPKYWNERHFCWKVAETEKLELLTWIREVKKFKWNEWTINAAAGSGNIEMVKYCVANECPMDEHACEFAAENGDLECLKYLHEVAKAPWEYGTASYAAANGHLHILEYLVEHEYDKYDATACKSAASNGHLDCLKYLHEVVKAPWDYGTADAAAANGHLHILEYLVEREYDQFDATACLFAACNGHLDCLKYLREVARAPWEYGTAMRAAANGHLHILEYLAERNYDKYDATACKFAAWNGHLDGLK